MEKAQAIMQKSARALSPVLEIQRVWRGRIARKRLEDVLPLLRKKWWERNSPLGAGSVGGQLWRLNVCHGVWGAPQIETPKVRADGVSFYPFEVIPDANGSCSAGDPVNLDDRADNINFQFGAMLVGFAEESPGIPRSSVSRDQFFCPGGPGEKWTKCKNFTEFSYLFDRGLTKMDREKKCFVSLSSHSIKKYPENLFKELYKNDSPDSSRTLIEGLQKEFCQLSLSAGRSRLSPYAPPFTPIHSS